MGFSKSWENGQGKKFSWILHKMQEKLQKCRNFSRKKLKLNSFVRTCAVCLGSGAGVIPEANRYSHTGIVHIVFILLDLRRNCIAKLLLLYKKFTLFMGSPIDGRTVV